MITGEVVLAASSCSTMPEASRCSCHGRKRSARDSEVVVDGKKLVFKPKKMRLRAPFHEESMVSPIANADGGSSNSGGSLIQS